MVSRIVFQVHTVDVVQLGSHRRCYMKNLLLTAIGLSLSLIIFQSLPYLGPHASGSAIPHNVYWINPDGSNGLAVEMVSSGQAGPTRHWVNPDGVQGIAGESTAGHSLVQSYVWINPDGSQGTFGRTPTHIAFTTR